MDPLKHAQRTKSREYSLDGVGDFPPLAIEQAIQWLGEGSRGAATSKLQTCTCFSRVFVCSYTAYSSPVHSRSGSFSPSHGTTCSQRVLRNPDACSPPLLLLTSVCRKWCHWASLGATWMTRRRMLMAITFAISPQAVGSSPKESMPYGQVN